MPCFKIVNTWNVLNTKNHYLCMYKVTRSNIKNCTYTNAYNSTLDETYLNNWS